MFTLRRLFGEEGSDIAEYAVTLAMILLMVIGTVRLMGGNIAIALNRVAHSFESVAAE
jgi:Flp pilus assembly pilin Flp